ncbi:MAG: hypothetical protein ACOXZZ_05270 [Sphaerochaetaceae bacterium]
MRKKIIGFLIIPILLIAVIGCDLDALSGLMGKMGTNVLTSTGAVTVDDTQTKKVSENISKVVDGAGKVDKEKLKEVKEDLKDILDSPKKAEDLKEKLKNDADPNTASKTNDELKEKLEDLFGNDHGLDFEITTEADLLVAVLVIDLLDTIDSAVDVGDFEDLDESEIMDIVSDAFFIIEVVNSLSSTGDVDVDDILQDFLANLGDGFRGVSRANSRDGGGDDFEVEEVIVPILKSVITAMDTNKNGVVSKSELDAMVVNYSFIRSSYESMAKALAKETSSKRRK